MEDVVEKTLDLITHRQLEFVLSCLSLTSEQAAERAGIGAGRFSAILRRSQPPLEEEVVAISRVLSRQQVAEERPKARSYQILCRSKSAESSLLVRFAEDVRDSVIEAELRAAVDDQCRRLIDVTVTEV
jgi:hypothetical protein